MIYLALFLWLVSVFASFLLGYHAGWEDFASWHRINRGLNE
jgi:hypothetical protein